MAQHDELKRLHEQVQHNEEMSECIFAGAEQASINDRDSGDMMHVRNQCKQL